MDTNVENLNTKSLPNIYRHESGCTGPLALTSFFLPFVCACVQHLVHTAMIEVHNII